VWSPLDPGMGVEGGSADVAGRRGLGGGLESGWVFVGSWRAPKIMGARPHKMGARPHKMGARPHSESTQYNRGAPSSRGEVR
jgi:hypothetical protein